MTRRSRAREVALQVLFQDDLNPKSSPEEGDALLRRRLKKAELLEFSRSLVAGVRRHRSELDEQIEKTAAHWSLHRMAVTDRNVLRLGAYEMFHSDTPGAWWSTRRSSWPSVTERPTRPSSSTGSSIA